jgi:hypothetical protein
VRAEGLALMFACPNPPIVYPLPEGDAWELREPFWFSWVGEDHPMIHGVVPCGFVTDGLSIPRFYRWRFSPTGRGFRAALAHDWMYRMGEYPQAVCDRVFRDGLQFCGVGAWERNLMFLTLRVGGGVAYGKSRRQRQAEKDAREREEA